MSQRDSFPIHYRSHSDNFYLCSCCSTGADWQDNILIEAVLSLSLSVQMAQCWAAVTSITVHHRSLLSAILVASPMFVPAHSSMSFSQVLAGLPLPLPANNAPLGQRCIMVTMVAVWMLRLAQRCIMVGIFAVWMSPLPNVGPTFKRFCKSGAMRQHFANRNMTFQNCLNLHVLININNF